MAERDSIHPQVLILAGTTASGKTDVSIPLARSLNAEIVSADSRQIYRELVIGSAPPNEEQLQAVKHHFIATKSLNERWTAGDFAKEARAIITSRAAEGKRTLVVGGSMLYLKALMDGLYKNENEPHIDYAALREEWIARGAEDMYRELCDLDIESANRTNPADHHRVLRAIGHFRATGRRLSEIRSAETQALSQSYRLYFLYGERQETYRRVNQRADIMLEHGLVGEVLELFLCGFDETNTNALKTHGYQEIFPYLRKEYDYEAMRAAIQQAVRRYVKRQLTWFRRDKRATWVERSFADYPEDVAIRIFLDFVGKSPIICKKPAD